MVLDLNTPHTMRTLLHGLGAGALSCVKPDFARSYQQAAKSQHRFIIVQGVLSFDASRLPKSDPGIGNKAPARNTELPARITGRFLSQKGFVTRFDQKITLKISCFGAWCATPRPGTDYLAFLRETPQGYLLHMNPCGGVAFAKPDAAMLNKALSCIRGGPCTAAPLH